MRVHTDWLLTPERAALHLPSAAAVVADLHLGYDHVRRHTGEAVPLVCADETIARLRPLLERHGVRRLVIAGDLFEDGRRGGPLTELLDWLRGAGVASVELVPGNHDRGVPTLPEGVQVCPEGVCLGAWRVVHGDAPARGWVVQGHVHPWLRLGSVSAPCFLVGPRRLVLPPFSADAAGCNVLRQRAWRDYRCYAVAADAVLDLGPVGTLPARAGKQHGART